MKLKKLLEYMPLMGIHIKERRVDSELKRMFGEDFLVDLYRNSGIIKDDLSNRFLRYHEISSLVLGNAGLLYLWFKLSH